MESTDSPTTYYGQSESLGTGVTSDQTYDTVFANVPTTEAPDSSWCPFDDGWCIGLIVVVTLVLILLISLIILAVYVRKLSKSKKTTTESLDVVASDPGRKERTGNEYFREPTTSPPGQVTAAPLREGGSTAAVNPAFRRSEQFPSDPVYSDMYEEVERARVQMHQAPTQQPPHGPAIPPTQGPAIPPTQGPAIPPTQGPAIPPTQGPAIPPTQPPMLPQAQHLAYRPPAVLPRTPFNQDQIPHHADPPVIPVSTNYHLFQPVYVEDFPYGQQGIPMRPVSTRNEMSLPPPALPPKTTQILQENDAVYEDTMVQQGVLLPPKARAAPIDMTGLNANPIYQRRPQVVGTPQNKPPAVESFYQTPPTPVQVIRPKSIYPLAPVVVPKPEQAVEEEYVIPPADYDDIGRVGASAGQMGEYTGLSPALPADTYYKTMRGSDPPLPIPVSQQQRPAYHPNNTYNNTLDELYQDLDDAGALSRQAPKRSTPTQVSDHRTRPHSPLPVEKAWPDDMYVDLAEAPEDRPPGAYYGNTPAPAVRSPPRELTEEEQRQVKLHKLLKRHAGDNQKPFAYFK